MFWLIGVYSHGITLTRKYIYEQKLFMGKPDKIKITVQ